MKSDRASRLVLCCFALLITGVEPPASAKDPVAIGAVTRDLPPEVATQTPFQFRVSWRLPDPVKEAPLHVELKDEAATVLQDHTIPVQKPAGEQVFAFTLPAGSAVNKVQIATWLGTNWQAPLGPIQLSGWIFVVSPGEKQRLDALRASQKTAAEVFLQAHPATRPASSEAAILDDPDLSHDGSMEAESILSAVKAAGYAVTRLNADNAGNSSILNKRRYGLLVLTDAGRLPVEIAPAVQAYLQDGGDLVVLGAPAWQTPLVRVASTGQKPRWLTNEAFEELVAQSPSFHPILRLQDASDIRDWTRATNQGGAKALYEVRGGALHVRVSDLSGWDTFQSPVLRKGLNTPFGVEETLTRVRARGDANTPSLALEWDETDGSRWIATIALSQEWRNYAVPPSAFHFWESIAGRGGSGDSFHPANASRLAVGLAFTHTGTNGGPHEYWIKDLAAGRSPFGDPEPGTPHIAPLDGLLPSYKFFDVHDAPQLVTADGAPVTGVTTLRSLQPRPDGSGIEKGRSQRFLPLLTARSASGEWRGIPAALLLRTGAAEPHNAWISFAVTSPSFYRNPKVLDLLECSLTRIHHGLFLQDGGADFYTYFPAQPVKMGGTAVNQGDSATGARVKITVRDGARVVFRQERPLAIGPRSEVPWSTTWRPERWPEGGYTVAVDLLTETGTEPIDHISHNIYAWTPSPRPAWITGHDGQFWLNGKPWKAHGVNYMPSSGVGLDDGDVFERWIDRAGYDPEIVQRDLETIKAVGFNALSIFIYHQSIPSQNLLDFLRRARNLDLHVNLGLRPGTPFDFRWEEMKEIIQYYLLPKNDTLFAYDLAWEPMFEGHDGRRRWDRDWEQWILDRYGSLESAGADWGFAVPREGGQVTNPPDSQLTADGGWNRMIAAYRRFADDLTGEKYAHARRLVQSVDPHHLVSFRMDETGDPSYQSGYMAFDFPGVAPAVDFLAPEGYGRIGDWSRVRPGEFERAYARWAAPGEPMTWAEVGMDIWDRDRMQVNAARSEAQGRFFDDFYRMMEASGANGIFFWWYPGGFRVGENSDFGVINPDRTDRPATASIRRHAREFIEAPTVFPQGLKVQIDRDNHASGLFGIYQDKADTFWKSVAAGHPPVLVAEGTGTTSANCPAVAVGNVPWTAHNPPKYLNALIEELKPATPAPGETLLSPATGPEIPDPTGNQVTVTNTGEAEWIAATDAKEKGSVWIVASTGSGDHVWWYPLPHNVRHMETITVRLSVPAGRLSVWIEDSGRGKIGGPGRG